MAYNATVAATALDAGILATVQHTVELHPPADLATEAQQSAVDNRQKFHLPVAGPTNATLSAVIQGCRVETSSVGRVTGALEGQLIENDPANGSQTGQFVQPFNVVWTSGGWKIDVGGLNGVASPVATVPGAAGVTADGWHACT